MSSGLRCPECGAPNRLLEALNESLFASAREPRLADALQRIVDIGRQLVGARFAAVGVPGADGRFELWVTSGGDAIDGEPPRMEGALEHVLRSRSAWVTRDLPREPAPMQWPQSLPPLASLLGVPIVADEEVLGAFYLGNRDGWGFAPEDAGIIELIAPHAAVAISNSRLHERSRELTVLQERTRLARELHDSVTQALFSMRLAADTALASAESDPEGARRQLERLRDLSRTSLSEMRALLAELRPPEVEARGIVETLRNHADVLRQVHGVDVRIEASLDGRLEARCESELFRLAQEALANAVRHSGAGSVVVRLDEHATGIRLTVSDDGSGFDPQAPVGHTGFGLTSMRERAAAMGAALRIDSSAGEGTLVAVEVPR